MKTVHRVTFWFSTTLLSLAAASLAAPIRVGLFSGNGQYLTHESMSTARNAITAILESAASANLGPQLLVSASGFEVVGHGCVTTNCRVSASQAHSFTESLDHLDVVVFVHYEGNGILSDTTFTPAQRTRIERFFRERGVVSIHATTSGNGGAGWPQWDSLHGARMQNHPTTDRLATLRLDSVAENDVHHKFLNRGLPDTTRILEEWFSFTVDGNIIRAVQGLKVTVRIDESSYNGGLGGARPMGADHPMSWYREFVGGGRFFYTALGHRPQHYLGTGTESAPATHFLRRQLYNAILWAAGVDSNGVVSVRGISEAKSAGFSAAARGSNRGGTLTVSLLQDRTHTIEIAGVDGRRIASRRGAGRGEYDFTHLGPGIHIVTVTTSAKKSSSRIMVP